MIAVCLAFFSPCDYVLPRRHLAQTLEWLSGKCVPVVLAQVVRPGQSPQPVPAGITSLVYESSDAIWFKESLWNMATRSVDADKLLFLDTDIAFSFDGVIEETDRLLDGVDVCQPFGTAVWHNEDGVVLNYRRSAAYAITHNLEPHPRLYHPGFSWAMTRDAFDAIGGWYERFAVGGADVAFAHSLDERWIRSDFTPEVARPLWKAPSFVEHQRRTLNARLAVGLLEHIEAHHMWHGRRDDRRYHTRCSYLPATINGELPLRRRPDGLLEWETPEQSAVALKYFASRREDG